MKNHPLRSVPRRVRVVAAVAAVAATVVGTGALALVAAPSQAEPHAGHAVTAAAHDHPASTGGPGGDPRLRRARAATEQYRDVDVAVADGYERSGDCEDDPKYGAMGVHFANPELIADGELDVEHPEVLVYEPTRDGSLRLVAIEYFAVDADQDLHTDGDRPWMFDLPFDGPMLGHNPDMPIHYDLHVWLYRHNPAGLFAMWNPAVECIEPTAHHDGSEEPTASAPLAP